MKVKPYSKYKPSGVEWLGDVPSHWTIAPFKWEIARNDGGVWGEDPYGDEGCIVLRSTEQTADGHWQINDPARRILSDAERTTALLVEGDLLITKSSGSSYHIGKTTLVDADVASLGACYSNFMQRVRTRPTFLPRLAWYVMNNRLARLQFDLLSNSTTGLANLNGTMVGQLLVTTPPFSEQNAIAAFLDRETSKIDTLITKQEKLIELLQEKRQAVISHAVTKGLDPTVPMKPSGVEWLGDVPEHWGLSPLKYQVKLESGGTPSKDKPEFWGHGYPWASAKDLKVEILTDTEDHITQAAIDSGAASLVEEDSVLVVVRGMILLHTLPVVLNSVPMAINQDLKALKSEKTMTPSYLAWLLRGLSREILGRTDQAAHGTKALRTGDWTGMMLPLPSIKDQLALSKYLAETTQKIDTLIAKSQQAIALQKEHRTALISAAVTGKIDVRELGEQEVAEEKAA